MAATMGLSSVVLKYDPSYPNYPEGLSPSEVAAGLPAAAAAQVLLKEGGAATLLILLVRNYPPSTPFLSKAFLLILPSSLRSSLRLRPLRQQNSVRPRLSLPTTSGWRTFARTRARRKFFASTMPRLSAGRS